MDDGHIQAEITVFAAIEILATGTEAPTDRLQSAVLRLHQVPMHALPEGLRETYETLLAQTAAAVEQQTTSGSPLSRLAYIELTTAFCTIYRRLRWG